MEKKKKPTKTEQEGIFAYQKGRCNYCGKKPVSMTGMHFDHIVRPEDWKSNDSVNDPKNIQCLCYDCHAVKTSLERKGKSDKEIRKFYKLLPSAKKAPTSQRFRDPNKYYSEIRFNKTTPKKGTKMKTTPKKVTKKKTTPKKVTKKKTTSKKVTKKKTYNEKLEDLFLIDPKQFK